MQNAQLEKHANNIRQDIIIETHSAQSGHPGCFLCL